MGPLDKSLHVFLLIIFDISGSYGENMEEKHQFHSEDQTEQRDADMDKK